MSKYFIKKALGDYDSKKWHLVFPYIKEALC